MFLVKPGWLVRFRGFLALFWLMPSPTGATMLIPVPLDHLQRAAEAIVVARVDALRTAFTQHGTIETEVHLTILHRVLGSLDAKSPLVLEVPGGEVGTEWEIVPGSPSFVPGQLYVLFLSQTPDSRWHPVQLELGVFTVISPPRSLQVRTPEPWVLGSPGVESENAWSWSEFWEGVRAVDPQARIPRFRSEWQATTAPAMAFQFGRPPARLFEPDEGRDVGFVIDDRGDPAFGPLQSREIVRQGLAAWSQVLGSSLRLIDAGTLQDSTVNCPDVRGQDFKVRFGDPDGAIPPPLDCRGMLALTSYRASTSETKGLAGQSFARIRCATVSFADGWEQCPEWTPCNVAEIATHELGHAIGLGHSSERVPEPNARLRDATMYVAAHFDGRCASLRADDLDAVRFLYPLPPPVTILGDTILPPATPGIPYAFPLELAHAQPPVSWTLGRSDYCGLELTDSGLLHGTIPACLCWSRPLPPPPTPQPTPYVFVTARDATCAWHTRFFSIPIAAPGSGTLPIPPCTPTATFKSAPSPTPASVSPCGAPATSTPTATPTPTTCPVPEFTATSTPTSSATATPSSSPTTPAVARSTATPTTPAACVGDCDRSGQVTVDEIVRMVNIALQALPVSRCVAGDQDGDGSVTIEELVRAVANLLHGCSAAPTP